MKFKSCLFFFLAVIIILLTASCKVEESGPVQETATQSEHTYAQYDTFSSKDKSEAAQAVLNCESVWLKFSNNDTSYISFIDIDFDGSPEFVTNSVDENYKSVNCVYKITDGALTAMEGFEKYGFDFFYGDFLGCPNVIKSKKNGKKYYMLYDRENASGSDYIETISAFSCENGKFSSEELLRIRCQGASAEIATSYMSGKKEMSKKDYKKLCEKFEQEWEIINLEYQLITVSDYDYRDTNGKYNLLTQCFDTFKTEVKSDDRQ